MVETPVHPELPNEAPPDPLAPAVGQRKATRFETALGAAFLVACIAVCGGFRGWLGKSDPGAGLGVGREAAQKALGEFGLAFRPIDDQRGYACEEAILPEGFGHVRLVGPRDDLVYASIELDPSKPKTEASETAAILYIIVVLKSTVPDWTPKESMSWVRECVDAMPTGKRQFEKESDNARVRFVVTPSPLAVTVSVESLKW